MAHNVQTGKQFSWWHFSRLEEADFSTLEEEFQFHPLDFDDLRDGGAFPKLDTYKYYLFLIFSIPGIDAKTRRINRQNLYVFIGKDYIVTATQHPIDAVDRFYARAARSSGLRREAMGKSTGYFLYKLLDYVFRDAKVILHELARETHRLEDNVYKRHTKAITRRLGFLRRDILFFRHAIDPQRMLMTQVANSNRAYIGKTLDVYFDDVKDTLDSMWVTSENLRDIVTGLFDINEAYLTHRTNEIIRLLTIISVVLMPPTLITSYYGMNIPGLPLSESIGLVSMIIAGSLIGFLAFIIFMDRRD